MLDPESSASYAKQPDGWIRVNAPEANGFRRRAETKDAAEMDATIAWANLEEDVLAAGHGFPRDCSPSAMTWF